MPKRKKIPFLIPVLIISALLVYTWIIFLVTDYVARVPHYLGLILFIPVLYCWYIDKSLTKPIIATGIYLLLATANLLAIEPAIKTSSYGIKLGSLEICTPTFNGLSFLLFVVYAILNFSSLVEIYLDYKEAKGKL